MVFAVVVAVLALPLGILFGWFLRGPARWCAKDGEPLRCLVCHPVGVATGRAMPRLYGQPQPSTVDRPLMTRGQMNRAPRISRRSI